MPTPWITITAEFSGSVVARGAGDDLSASILKHAGFQQIDDWLGRRHRLPTTTPFAEQVAIVTHAAEMLRAARYDVDLDPSLDTAGMSTPARPLGSYAAGAELLQITDRIRSAENGADLQRAVDHLLHPEHGALERVREALEAAGEQINDLDDEAYALADRFGGASEFVIAAQSELIGAEGELCHVGSAQGHQTDARTGSPKAPVPHDAATATSPAAANARVSPSLSGEAAQVGPAGRPPDAPSPRR